MKQFIELTVLVDSFDTLVSPRSALLRADQVVSVTDVSSAGFVDGVRTSISTAEPSDEVNTDDKTGGVIRSVRQLFVKEPFEAVRAMLERALD